MAAKQLRTMDTDGLIALRKRIDAVLAARRKELQAQLAALEDGARDGKSKTERPGNGRRQRRAKAKPKYQSKKNRSLKWSGRGMTPVWMREEMKGTKLKKADFLIK